MVLTRKRSEAANSKPAKEQTGPAEMTGDGSVTHRAERMSEDPEAHDDGLISYSEICKHKTGADCWIVVNKKVFDV